MSDLGVDVHNLNPAHSGHAGVVRQDTAFGYLDKSVNAHQFYNPVLVSNRDTNTMYHALVHELRRSTRFVFSVAFVTSDAIAMLKQALVDFPGHGTIITSTYLGFNTPEVFRELANLRPLGVEVQIFDSSRSGFHAKGFIFDQAGGTTAIVGSSNLTASALKSNLEWNLRFSALPDGDIVDQLKHAVNDIQQYCTPLEDAWIEEYERSYVPPQRSTVVPSPVPGMADDRRSIGPKVVPNAMQREALEAIAQVRDAGERRALVVSATGTGKTILAALDVQAVQTAAQVAGATQPKRVLFLAHREQILDRAREEFTHVLDLDQDQVGKYVGNRREIDKQYVFATVQTLGDQAKLSTIPRDHFDYILVDEVHRAGAAQHRKVIDYFAPEFLLGITATPERTDGFNVYELFDYNVPYEIRLQKAMEADMLAPFHYYGVTDIEIDGEVVSENTKLDKLVSPERIDHVITAIETYGHVGVQVKGLIFCSGRQEAHHLSALLDQREVHGKRLRTKALTGEDSIEARQDAVDQLEAGELDYLITVDIFNEGIDIRSVNQVVMLRNTQSSIIFTQQLGRGLRKAADKSHLIVIDVIGNYTNNFLVPIALFGDTSLNKDTVRRHMIEAQDVGALPGLSSVSFDQIAKERIFESIKNTRLDGIQNLKKSFNDLRARLGSIPTLYDFARFDLVDPVVIASDQKSGSWRNYWALLHRFDSSTEGPTEVQDKALSFLSTELLNGKRPHELLVLDALTKGNQPVHESEITAMFVDHELPADGDTVASVRRILTYDFFTEVEVKRYGNPLVTWSDDGIRLSSWFATQIASSPQFAAHVDDVLRTGLYLARHRYSWRAVLEKGQKYSRKDVCRLLNWKSNQMGTMYGYKVDAFSRTCPIFVTYHKDDEVSASTSYEDEFLSERTLQWYSKSNRTLKSKEVQSILTHEVPLHLFAKKDDAEGTEFYYLGRAEASDPIQTTMPGNKGDLLDVVRMNLTVDSPIEQALFTYLTKATTNKEAE